MPEQKISKKLKLFDPTMDYCKKVARNVSKCNGPFEKMVVIQAGLYPGVILTPKEAERIVDKAIMKAFTEKQ